MAFNPEVTRSARAAVVSTLVKALRARAAKLATYDKALNNTYVKFSRTASFAPAKLRRLATLLSQMRAVVNRERQGALRDLHATVQRSIRNRAIVAQYEDLSLLSAKLASLLVTARASLKRADAPMDEHDVVDIDSNGYVQPTAADDDSGAPTDENLSQAAGEDELESLDTDNSASASYPVPEGMIDPTTEVPPAPPQTAPAIDKLRGAGRHSAARRASLAAAIRGLAKRAKWSEALLTVVAKSMDPAATSVDDMADDALADLQDDLQTGKFPAKDKTATVIRARVRLLAAHRAYKRASDAPDGMREVAPPTPPHAVAGEDELGGYDTYDPEADGNIPDAPEPVDTTVADEPYTAGRRGSRIAANIGEFQKVLEGVGFKLEKTTPLESGVKVFDYTKGRYSVELSGSSSGGIVWECYKGFTFMSDGSDDLGKFKADVGKLMGKAVSVRNRADADADPDSDPTARRARNRADADPDQIEPDPNDPTARRGRRADDSQIDDELDNQLIPAEHPDPTPVDDVVTAGRRGRSRTQGNSTDPNMGENADPAPASDTVSPEMDVTADLDLPDPGLDDILNSEILDDGAGGEIPGEGDEDIPDEVEVAARASTRQARQATATLRASGVRDGSPRGDVLSEMVDEIMFA